jgi:hypothetical protein
MNKQGDERLNTLNAIAQECFGIETLPLADGAQEARYMIDADSLVRALESAYDIGLIAGYRLNRIHVAHSMPMRYQEEEAGAH